MKKSTGRRRRHRNPKKQELKKPAPFFSGDNPTHAQANLENGFFQSKLEVSPANNPAEKEADKTADKVIKNTQVNPDSIQQKEMVSRQVEEEESQTKLEIQRQVEEEEPQAKLQIQKQMEEEEPQAKLELQRQAEEEEEAQTKLEIQRQIEEEEPQAKLEIQCEMEEEEPQAKQEADTQHKSEKQEQKKGQKEADIPMEELIMKTKGKGFPIPDDIRVEMEAEFEADFSQVSIHTDDDAIRLNRHFKAQAFTHGYDIYFNQGKYNPDTQTGKHLLAHELTHVVQQKGN